MTAQDGPMQRLSMKAAHYSHSALIRNVDWQAGTISRSAVTPPRFGDRV
jgi:hypothetical protein